MNRRDELLNAFSTKQNVVKRNFMCGKKKACLLFNPDMTDAEALRQTLRAALDGVKTDLKELEECTVYISESKIVFSFDEAMRAILDGDGVIIVDGLNGYLVVNVRKYEKRAVIEPPTETAVKGPREGFIEDLKTNLSLLQRRLRTPKLAIERMSLGVYGGNNIAIVYIDGIIDKEIVEKVKKRLQAIEIDAVLDSHYLVSYLEEKPNSLFTQIGNTEKPDIAAAKLLEGRLAIIVDGSPLVLTLPFIMMEDFQAADDYYERNNFSSFLRFIRLFAVLFAVFLPGAYIAFLTYHYDMLPYRFLLTLMNAVKGIPFPPLWEMLVVIILFELIREASVRMPRAVGMAMAIVGALVLGDTAVKAGIVSSPAVLIAALSSIALYAVPNEVGTVSLLRLIFAIAGGVVGILGLLMATVFILHYMCGLSSYGAPYLSPLAPLIPADLKDCFIRTPRKNMKTRPQSLQNKNKTRAGS